MRGAAWVGGVVKVLAWAVGKCVRSRSTTTLCEGGTPDAGAASVRRVGEGSGPKHGVAEMCTVYAGIFTYERDGARVKSSAHDRARHQ